MLSEIPNVKQLKDEPRRRWFSSSSLDLFVWYDNNDEILQFQICYDKGQGERALTWHREKGLLHHAVDDGESRTFRMKGTPILLGESEYDAGEILTKFQDLAGEMEYALVNFIVEKIQPEGRTGQNPAQS